MMYLGAILFVLIFVMLTPQAQAFLGSVLTFMTAWAPYSYIFLLIMFGLMFAGYYVIRTWPEHVEPESPMAKYRREAPVEEDN
ncbi:MAG: hypothetical protein JWP63_2806 [Candidatus Solibacter sp.]|jgi:purine-cytosine permease-like protein|nr:hypothetical protein [Candidatus Solibacter sp.]